MHVNIDHDLYTLWCVWGQSACHRIFCVPFVNILIWHSILMKIEWKKQPKTTNERQLLNEGTVEWGNGKSFHLSIFFLYPFWFLFVLFNKIRRNGCTLYVNMTSIDIDVGIPYLLLESFWCTVHIQYIHVYNTYKHKYGIWVIWIVFAIMYSSSPCRLFVRSISFFNFFWPDLLRLLEYRWLNCAVFIFHDMLVSGEWWEITSFAIPNSMLLSLYYVESNEYDVYVPCTSIWP